MIYIISRIIKNIINNFNKKNISIIFSDKSFSKTYIESKINRQEIFIITSCLNPNDLTEKIISSYTNIENRYQETVETIKSIKYNFVDPYIILLENSNIPTQYFDSLVTQVDELIDYSKNRYILKSRQHNNKGVPQFAMIYKFIFENKNKYLFDTLHFISARYVLHSNISNNYIEYGSYLLFYKNSKNVSTRYYFFKKCKLDRLKIAYKYTLLLAILGNSVEDVIFLFTPKNNYLNKIDLSGKVAGIQFIHE
jgi:hypothetical protein